MIVIRIKDNILLFKLDSRTKKEIKKLLSSKHYNFIYVEKMAEILKTNQINLIIADANIWNQQLTDVIDDFAEKEFIPILTLAKSVHYYKRNQSSINNPEHLKYLVKTLCRVSWVSKQFKNSPKTLEVSYLKTIELIDMLDTHMKSHSSKVINWCLKIGRALRLENQDLDVLNQASLLHDIGKTIIPKEILTHSGKLSKNEYEIIKLHTLLLEHFMPKHHEKVKQVIRHHHEKYDGSGYPDNLKGSDIPLLSRIVTVVDSFDAMTSKRLYNTPISYEEAINVLKEDSNTHFDPYLVSVFIDVLNEEVAEARKKESNTHFSSKLAPVFTSTLI